MGLNIFLYIGFNFVLLHLFGVGNTLVNSCISVLCVVSILTLGVGHGAVDDILHGSQRKKMPWEFLCKYLLLACGMALLWYWQPNAALAVFLCNSAFHFGESQFSEYAIRPFALRTVLHCFWGTLVLLLSIYFNIGEVQALINAYFPQLTLFTLVTEKSGILLCASTSITLGLLIYAFSRGWISLSKLTHELYLLILLALSFYVFDLLTGFTLFFVFIHSLKVIIQEFTFFHNTLKISKIRHFLKLFLPYMTISLLAIGGTVLLLDYFQVMASLPVVFMVMLSAVTLPHSFVMNLFYENKSGG